MIRGKKMTQHEMYDENNQCIAQLKTLKRGNKMTQHEMHDDNKYRKYKWKITIQTENITTLFETNTQEEVLNAIKKSFRIMKKDSEITITKN